MGHYFLDTQYTLHKGRCKEQQHNNRVDLYSFNIHSLAISLALS